MKLFGITLWGSKPRQEDSNNNYYNGFLRDDPRRAEIDAAVAAGCSWLDYRYARYNRASHDEVLAAHKAGCVIFRYSIARYKGIAHDEAVLRTQTITPYEKNKAYLACCDMQQYEKARINGASHDDAILRSK